MQPGNSRRSSRTSCAWKRFSAISPPPLSSPVRALRITPYFYLNLRTPIDHVSAGSADKLVGVSLVHRLSRVSDASDDRYWVDAEQPANQAYDHDPDNDLLLEFIHNRYAFLFLSCQGIAHHPPKIRIETVYSASASRQSLLPFIIVHVFSAIPDYGRLLVDNPCVICDTFTCKKSPAFSTLQPYYIYFTFYFYRRESITCITS